MTGIYCIKNIKNGKCYIGSSNDTESRFKQHLYLLRLNKHHSVIFQRAWNKYGKENFEFSIIVKCPFEYLIKMEQWFIDTLNPSYNILKTAYSLKGFRHSDENCKKMSERMKGKPAWNKGIPFSEETKIKMSEVKKGKSNFKGHNHSEKTKLKISVAKSGIKNTKEQNKKIGEVFSKPINKLDLNGSFIKEYKSIGETSEDCNISRYMVVRMLNEKKLRLKKLDFLLEFKK